MRTKFRVIKAITLFFLFYALCELSLKLDLYIFKAAWCTVAVGIGRWQHQFFFFEGPMTLSSHGLTCLYLSIWEAVQYGAVERQRIWSLQSG